jgi:pimeloyl-ACP methyl ester carboxylesterase
MRGYGDSEKPSGVNNYAMDLLVDDVKLVVEALGSYLKFVTHLIIQLQSI